MHLNPHTAQKRPQGKLMPIWEDNLYMDK